MIVCPCHHWVWSQGQALLQLHRIAGTRDSRAVLLTEDTSGQGAWVSHREGGVIFVLDVTLCMFSRYVIYHTTQHRSKQTVA
jgi:hypothetical protein